MLIKELEETFSPGSQWLVSQPSSTFWWKRAIKSPLGHWGEWEPKYGPDLSVDLWERCARGHCLDCTSKEHTGNLHPFCFFQERGKHQEMALGEPSSWCKASEEGEVQAAHAHSNVQKHKQEGSANALPSHTHLLKPFLCRKSRVVCLLFQHIASFSSLPQSIVQFSSFPPCFALPSFSSCLTLSPCECYLVVTFYFSRI